MPIKLIHSTGLKGLFRQSGVGAITLGFPHNPRAFYLYREVRFDGNPPATFLVQADSGGSMIDYGIHDGDLLIVDRSIQARHGHTVIALWEGGFTVKKLFIRGNRVVLAASAGFSPIVVPEEVELDIWGVVRSSIHFHV